MSALRVVIAGGRGFLGRALGPHLLDAGYEVDVLTRARTGSVVGNAVVWDGATPNNA
jgi:nucleoside-diphosphate-sugar epimerase